MSTPPLEVQSFRSICGILCKDKAILFTVARALAKAATEGEPAAIAWIQSDDRAVGGGWSDFALAAFFALTPGSRRRNAWPLN